MTRAGLRVLFALASLSAIGACEGEAIVVFSSSPAGAGGIAAGASGAGMGGAPNNAAGSAGNAVPSASSGGGEKVCQSLTDCDPSWFCGKQDCADPQGLCVPSPVFEDPQLAPVCGCDNVTYWSDSLRQAAGVSAVLMAGACQSNAKLCFSDNECAPTGSCNINLRDVNACGMPGVGQCWLTPTDCASTTEKPRWVPCPAPGMPPGAPFPQCLTTCEAVQSGQPYLQAPKGACH